MKEKSSKGAALLNIEFVQGLQYNNIRLKMEGEHSLKIGYEQENDEACWNDMAAGGKNDEKNLKKHSYLPIKTNSSHAQNEQFSNSILQRMNEMNLNAKYFISEVEFTEYDINFFATKLYSLFQAYLNKCQKILHRSLQTDFAIKRQRVQFGMDSDFLFEIIDMNIILPEYQLNQMKASLKIYQNIRKVFSILLFKLWPHLRDEAVYILKVILFQINQIKPKKNQQEIIMSMEEICSEIHEKIVEGYNIEEFLFRDDSQECRENFVHFIKEWSRIFISLEVISAAESLQAMKDNSSGSSKKEFDLFDFGSHQEDQFSCSHEDLPISFPRKRLQRQQDQD